MKLVKSKKGLITIHLGENNFFQITEKGIKLEDKLANRIKNSMIIVEDIIDEKVIKVEPLIEEPKDIKIEEEIKENNIEVEPEVLEERIEEIKINEEEIKIIEEDKVLIEVPNKRKSRKNKK